MKGDKSMAVFVKSLQCNWDLTLYICVCSAGSWLYLRRALSREQAGEGVLQLAHGRYRYVTVFVTHHLTQSRNLTGAECVL